MFYKLCCFLAAMIAVMYICYPTKSYLVDKKLVPLLPVEFMFIDQSTQSGFLLASIIQMILGIYGICGIEFVALSFVILIMNYAPQIDIVEIDFNELDVLWRDTSTSTLAYRHMFLRNICQKYIDMRR